MDVYATFLRTVRRHRLLRPGERVLVAVSGGADSTALLHLLAACRQEDQRLAVAHLDHGMRGEASRQDADFVARMARGLGLELFTERLESGDNQDGVSEECLRNARHAFLHQVAARWPATRIALGHNRGDQAETLLLNLIRGAGTRGLGGMRVLVEPPQRTTAVIRPMLWIPHGDLVAWLESQGLGWCQDASNQDPRFLRNRVRQELLPLLEDLRPGATAAMARAAHLLQEDEELLDRLVPRELLWRREPGGNRVDAASLRTLSPPLARRLLRLAAAAAAVDGKAGKEDSDFTATPAWRPGTRQVQEVLDLVLAGKKGAVDQGKGIVAQVDRATVVFLPSPESHG